MKTLFKRTEDLMAEAAMNEEGTSLGAVTVKGCDPFEETLEENLIEVAFAEAADYDDIHEAILREHRLHCTAA
jgi:hypothetical protein